MSKKKFVVIFALFTIIVGVWFLPNSRSESYPPLQKEIFTQIQENKEEKQKIVLLEERVSSPISIIEDQNIETIRSTSSDSDLPEERDVVAQLFTPHSPILPIVETVSYVSRVPWLIDRPAYLGDWAAHYETSKHFISRSIRGAGLYLNEKVSRGDRFNVLRKDKVIEFHMVVDLSRTRLWLYYFDKNENQRQLLKSYPICVGKLTPEKRSGSLTPTGVFEVGREVAVYKEGDRGIYLNEMCEMITVFGQRWIPLSREIADCSGSCRGLGLHGVPWARDPETGLFVEKRECIGGYSSLGSIRLLTEDIQEIFSIVTSRRSYVHIVKDFQEACLPGKEI
jgi:hypothetical protein